jgi:hypothetical protein
MADLDLLLDAEPPAAPPSLTAAALGLARAKLKPPIPRASMWPLVWAAGLAASAALSLAAVVILGPPSVGGQQVDVNPGMR